MGHLLLRSTIAATINQTYTWKDILTERLKASRGSAIKRHARGRALEDFAIPNKKHPQILIEAKAYGAMGSKQTDVLGDVTRILEEKRTDTPFLLVTDGITWNSRVDDLRRLVAMQNKGEIYRIYTKSMEDALYIDLSQMKQKKGL